MYQRVIKLHHLKNMYIPKVFNVFTRDFMDIFGVGVFSLKIWRSIWIMLIF